MTTVAELAADAIGQLGIGPSPVTAESVDSWPSRPGLYAVYGSADVWRTLHLGDPPDGRPLYVGKAERSLSSRDVGTHFGFAGKGGNSVTGTSTLRRTLSALLRTQLGFRGRYRNPARREKASHFGLSRDHDAALSDWMRGNLVATYWEMPTLEVALDDVETAVLRRLEPPLNIAKVLHRWTKQVKEARQVMAADCSKEPD
jgi:GIY-YIG catalytic domain-containing protein